jgi:hypothetical protein
MTQSVANKTPNLALCVLGMGGWEVCIRYILEVSNLRKAQECDLSFSCAPDSVPPLPQRLPLACKSRHRDSVIVFPVHFRPIYSSISSVPPSHPSVRTCLPVLDALHIVALKPPFRGPIGPFMLFCPTKWALGSTRPSVIALRCARLELGPTLASCSGLCAGRLQRRRSKPAADRPLIQWHHVLQSPEDCLLSKAPGQAHKVHTRTLSCFSSTLIIDVRFALEPTLYQLAHPRTRAMHNYLVVLCNVGIAHKPAGVGSFPSTLSTLLFNLPYGARFSTRLADIQGVCVSKPIIAV